MRRSKIVCTLGPAVDSHEQLVALIEAGMSVARFNFSHGTHEEHQGRYDRVRKAADDTGRAVGVLADLQGPKIRLAKFAEGPVELVRGTSSRSPPRTSRATSRSAAPPTRACQATSPRATPS
ncbi:hypothetical protein Sfulv_43040 [Streptomyces fulvorobeus]|uniref:pyruvate kinase n=1 Tax=Streptomyces fulvorobeus TaxID=284028 RepID=A0A7J0CC75_9ACTN|nr:hypothetical protein Sfulv_43040 [Streptomyces fulvorobeus]